MNKILIIGHARHGKDTLAEILREEYGLTHRGSSQAAAEIFIYDKLREKYNYTSPEECFEDRVNHRAEWYELIREYNQEDRARLAKEIMKFNDVYVGMRDKDEIHSSLAQGVFDLVIGVYKPDQSLESPDSFNIDLWESSDIVIPNSGSIEDLRNRVKKLIPCIYP